MLKIALLLFTASRTIDLFVWVLGPENMIVGIFGLAALDIGLIGWSEFYKHGATGSGQRSVAMLMTVVDLVGVVVAFIADMLMSAGRRGLTYEMDANTSQAVIVAIGVIIAANIGSMIVNSMLDPENQRKQREEEARAKIHEAMLEQIDSNAESLAAELAPQQARHWMDTERVAQLAESQRRWSKVEEKPLSEKLAEALEAIRKTEAKSGNGHNKPASVTMAADSPIPKEILDELRERLSAPKA